MGTPLGNLGVLPKGDYKLRLEDVECRVSEKSGNYWIPWTFMVLEPGSMAGRKCKVATGLGNEAGEQLTQELLLGLGANRETDVPTEDSERMTDFLKKYIGKVVSASVDIRVDNNKTSRNSIPFGGVRPSQASGQPPF